MFSSIKYFLKSVQIFSIFFTFCHPKKKIRKSKILRNNISIMRTFPIRGVFSGFHNLVWRVTKNNRTSKFEASRDTTSSSHFPKTGTLVMCGVGMGI